jgi:hypothetical protein
MRPDGVGHAQRLEQALSSERRDILPGRLLEHARSLALLYQTVAPCTDWFSYTQLHAESVRFPVLSPRARRPVTLTLRRTIHVALSPERALHAFTPVGERAWAHGWDPIFPAGEHRDGAEPGTVFTTEAHGYTTLWVVADRRLDAVRYARVAPGDLAGLVEVRCTAAEDGGTTAEVTYELTALSDDAGPELERFTADYEAYIGEWERAIAEAISTGRLR